MRWLAGIINAMDTNLGKLWEMVRDRKACHAAVHGGDAQSKSTRLAQAWIQTAVCPPPSLARNHEVILPPHWADHLPKPVPFVGGIKSN